MNVAADGEMASNPNGLTGTHPSTAVTHTTWPAPLVVELRPSDSRAGDMVPRTVSSVRER